MRGMGGGDPNRPKTEGWRSRRASGASNRTPRSVRTCVTTPKNTVGPISTPRREPLGSPNRRPGSTETAPHGEPTGSGEREPTYPVASTVRSTPTRLALVSAPSSAMVAVGVRAARHVPNTKPRAPPMIAPSSMKEPSRAVSDSAAIGPACTARATPTSTPSTCHPLPTVYASPRVSALPCPASGVDKPTRAVNIVSMDRRTFVLLTGATSGALIRPPVRLSHSPTGADRRSGAPAIGRLRFELDDHHRWSLWYYGEGSPVPLVRGAEIVAWVGDHPLTLAELEDSTVGNRRPPGGDAVVVRGRAAGVWVEAELLAAGGADAPQASVTVTIFPDRFLPTVRGVRFFQLPHAELLAGDAPLVALVNGAHSADPCRVVVVGAPEAEELASHAALGLTRGSRGLAIAFDAGDPGNARVQLSRDGLEAVSDWLPARPLRPEGDATRMRLCFHPEGDGLEALRALFVPSSPVDQERLAQAVAPTGWCTRSEWPGTVAEGDVIANLDFGAANFDRRFFRHIELDDGHQPAIGAWDVNDPFPHGHPRLTDQNHAPGL